MKNFYRLIIFITIISCSTEENAIDFVFNNITRGAVLRTYDIQNDNLFIGDDEPISIFVEELDSKMGNLLDQVNVLVSYRSVDGAFGEIKFLESIESENFSRSENDLPLLELSYTSNELSELFNLSASLLSCGDQFKIDLQLVLTDGRVFDTHTAGDTVIAADGFFDSPFTYLVNVVEPIDDELFTGFYEMQFIQVGNAGPTFSTDALYELRTIRRNVRAFTVSNSYENIALNIEVAFTLVCDHTVMRTYQKSGITCAGGIAEDELTEYDFSNQLLLGPSAVSGLMNPDDDAVFELFYIEGYDGVLGNCDIEPSTVGLRFTKQ